jgi:Domain of unknown function (DUF4136)
MLRKLLITSLLVLFSAVGAAAQVRVDFDRHRDFSKYRTISVEVGPLVRADGVADEHNTLAEDRLRQAVTNEFLARGIESTDAGSQLIVRVSARDIERDEIVSAGWGPYSPYWSWRWGYWRRPYYYGRWGAFYDGPVLTRRYVEELLTIDVVDGDTGALVYRAQVSGEVGKDRDKDVTKAVDKAFKKFPVKESSSR